MAHDVLVLRVVHQLRCTGCLLLVLRLLGQRGERRQRGGLLGCWRLLLLLLLLRRRLLSLLLALALVLLLLSELLPIAG